MLNRHLHATIAPLLASYTCKVIEQEAIYIVICLTSAGKLEGYMPFAFGELVPCP